MIKVEEPSKQKLEKIKIGSISGACPYLIPQRDRGRGVTYEFFVPDPKENEEKDPFEDNDKENG